MSEAFVAHHDLLRLTADWSTGTDAHASMPKAGALVAVKDGHPDLAISGLDGRGFTRKLVDLQFERAPALTAADFPALFEFYLRGRAILPNLQPVDTLDGLRTIASWGGAGVWPRLANVKVPGETARWGTWARVFLGYTQGQKLDGSGYLIAYQRNVDPREAGPVYRFALCSHVAVTGAGANPSRGWHPARCSRCGLDLSVDSGD